jgi:hypothetical protein
MMLTTRRGELATVFGPQDDDEDEDDRPDDDDDDEKPKPARWTLTQVLTGGMHRRPESATVGPDHAAQYC